MKKILGLLSCIMMVGMLTVNAYAASDINADEQKIIDALNTGVLVDGKMVKLDASYINSAKTYFASDGVDVSSTQAAVVESQINSAKQIVIDNKITDLTTMPKQFQDQIITKAQIAASELGLTISADYSAKNIIVKDKNGKVIFSASKTIKNTGDDFTSTLVISGAIALILAGAGIVAIRKGLFSKA